MTAFMDSQEPKVDTEVDTKVETSHTCDLTELVRGSERQLIDQLAAAVRRETVSLDLGSVERIDAAGIAALISLYRTAQDSGHGFSLANVAPRVRELLRLVGLESILVSHNAKSVSDSAPGLVQSAA